MLERSASLATLMLDERPELAQETKQMAMECCRDALYGLKPKRVKPCTKLFKGYAAGVAAVVGYIDHAVKGAKTTSPAPLTSPARLTHSRSCLGLGAWESRHRQVGRINGAMRAAFGSQVHRSTTGLVPARRCASTPMLCEWTPQPLRSASAPVAMQHSEETTVATEPQQSDHALRCKGEGLSAE